MCKVQEGEAGEAEEEEVAEAAALITIVGLLLKGNTRHEGHEGCCAGFFRLSALSLTYINTERGEGRTGSQAE